MFIRHALLFGSLTGALFLAACSQEAPKRAHKPAPAKVASAPPSPHLGNEEGRKQFVGRCAACHGMEGKGDGPGAVALNPKPRNYTDKVWQKSVTDEQIGNTIMYGGAAVGKSPIMPAHPDLQSKPEAVAALVKVVRAFGE